MTHAPMHVQSVKVTAHSRKTRPGILAAFIVAQLSAVGMLLNAWSQDLYWQDSAISPTAAGSGTWAVGGTAWSAAPGSVGAPGPWVDGRAAHFIGSSGGTVTLGSAITVTNINFDPPASTFTINTNGNALTIEGTGIVNNSGLTQTIVNNGGTVDSPQGGLTHFVGTSTAGDATIITNGGTGGGGGGQTLFTAASNGGTARAMTNGNGRFDISGLTTTGMGIGSIEGSGNYFLGGKNLSVGSNNLSTTVSGVIRDGGTSGGTGGSLTKVGTGTLTLTGTSTYTGGTTIRAGTLVLAGGGLAPAGAVVVDNGGTFDISPGGIQTIGDLSGTGTVNLGENQLTVGTANNTTFGGTISDGGQQGNLVKQGTGTLALTGNNTYTGGTTINAGTLAVSRDANLGGTTGFLSSLSFNGGTLEALAAGGGLTSGRRITLGTGGGSFLADAGTASVLRGAITGPGAWTKDGPGILTLTGANTYGGGTFLNGGVLAVNSDANLGSGPLSFNGGTLEVLAAGRGFTSAKGITLGAGGSTFLADAGAALTLSGAITGPGTLTKTGGGTLTLTGANAYSGGTFLNGGILAVNSDANLGSGPLSFDGGTLEALAAGGGLTSAKGTTLAAGGGTFLADAGTASTLGGAISGPGAWTKAGAGTLTLTGADTYSGGTTVSAGILALAGAGRLVSTGAVVVSNGGTFDISQGGNQTIGDLSGAGAVNLGGRQLTVGTANSTTFAGTITDGGLGGGTGGSVLKQGTGTLTLTGANTYSGGTFLNAGTLAVNSDANLGSGPLSFNGGTLEALGAGGGLTSAKGINLGAGGGTFLADAGTASTLNGAISGPGAWTKAGAGTLILTGTNTYSGGTTISGGTLQLGNGGTAGGIVGNVTDNGIVAFDRLGALTFNGVIGGVGSVQQIGTGTVVLTGDNTYTGGTAIAPGSTLRLGNGGSTGSVMGDIFDNGTLVVDRSNTLTLAGVISGGGGLRQNGPGTLILTGANTYTGGTTISAGTLQLGNGGASGNIIGNVVDNGSLIFDRSDAVTFGGVISGTGNVTQAGTGTLILTGDNAYTGPTTINAGSLIIDGSTASALTTVNPGGLLGGHGTLGGSLLNRGIVSPGDSPGTLTVAGNYTQTAAGTLRIEVAGLAPGAHDLLVVSGHASLAGTLQVIRVGGFQLHVGDQVTFLTAAGGVSGTFGTVENGFNTGSAVKAQVIYQPTAVLLKGTQGSFGTAACNPNSAAVARSLDAAVGDPRAAGLIAFLDNEPFNQLCRDFELIAPEELTAFDTLGIALANVQTANLERRLGDVQCGSAGFSASGFSFSLSGRASGVNSAGLAGVSGPEGKEGPPGPAPIPENRWGLFVTGLGEFTNVGSTANAAGFDARTGGVTLGADYRLSPNLVVGLLGGYAHTDIGLARGGSLEADGGNLGLYATTFGCCGWYLDGAVTGGLSAYDSRRTALLGRARGSTEGGNLNVLVAGGYDWTRGGLTVGPTASFQYTWVGVDGFTEHGSLVPLKIDDQHAESKRTSLGLKAAYDWRVGRVVVSPEIRVAWQHEFGQTQYAVASSFANGAGTAFSVTGAGIGHDSLLLGAGVMVRWNDRFAVFAYYDGEVGRTNYDSHSVSAGVRVIF